jgi:hypothetical protein
MGKTQVRGISGQGWDKNIACDCLLAIVMLASGQMTAQNPTFIAAYFIQGINTTAKISYPWIQNTDDS